MDWDVKHQLKQQVTSKERVSPLKTRNPLTGTLANSEDPDEMPHNSSRSALFAKTKLIFRDGNTIIFGNHNL